MTIGTAESVLRQSPALPRGFFALGDAALDGLLYLAPAGLAWGPQADAAILSANGWSLAGTPRAFTLVSVLLREGGQVIEAIAPFDAVLTWSMEEGEHVARFVGERLNAIGSRRPPFAGLAMEDGPVLMGIVNVTPDSFSDGGRFFGAQAAVEHGLALLEAGAGIIDVGGESTRPGADPVSPDEEARRVVPVVRALAERGAVVSIDTRHAHVMGAAIEAGAAVINDVSALTDDPESLAVAARSGASVVLMHMQGDPRTMQAEPRYDCAPLDVYDYLAGRLAAARSAGIPLERLCVDPGIGFGKTLDHNLQILNRLGLYHALGVPVLLGASRKSFIGRLSRAEPADQRLPGSLAAALAGTEAGCQFIRVHDVAETAQALKVWQALNRGGAHV